MLNRQFPFPVRIENWKFAKETFPFRSVESFSFRSRPRKIVYKWKFPFLIVAKSLLQSYSFSIMF